MAILDIAQGSFNEPHVHVFNEVGARDAGREFSGRKDGFDRVSFYGLFQYALTLIRTVLGLTVVDRTHLRTERYWILQRNPTPHDKVLAAVNTDRELPNGVEDVFGYGRRRRVNRTFRRGTEVVGDKPFPRGSWNACKSLSRSSPIAIDDIVRRSVSTALRKPSHKLVDSSQMLRQPFVIGV
ncbi:MAG: hypothetical protein NTX53_19040 [candidate division WOR-3 bacterium]|nr:hypothetical protein [candidate division WOR-3 bacterium]